MSGTIRKYWASVVVVAALFFGAVCFSTVRAEDESSSSEKPAEQASARSGKAGKNADPVVSGRKRVTLRLSAVAEGAERAVVGREIADERDVASRSQYVLEDELGKLRFFDADDVESVEDEPDCKLSELRATISKRLLDEFGPDFETTISEHFIFVSDASEGYVEWCSRLFESLESGFGKYLAKNGCDLPERVEPMIVVIFSRKSDFKEYAAKETSGSDMIAAYYNLETNRVVLYDLSEVESYRGDEGRRRRPYQEVKEFLSRPNAAFNVATIVHEATHQIAFNREFFHRAGPIALWAVEGLSLLFETPTGKVYQDGWKYRAVFPTNTRQLAFFIDFARKTKRENPVRDLFYDEEDFKSEDLLGFYSVSWALFYYLQKNKPKELAAYIQEVGSRPPRSVYPPEERAADFEKYFGNNWDKLSGSLLRFVRKLR